MASLESVKNWDDETDILVVGCGLSGVVTAIVAHTGGAKRNAKSQVLDFNANPIPRIFEVDEKGSIVANIYQIWLIFNRM